MLHDFEEFENICSFSYLLDASNFWNFEKQKVARVVHTPYFLLQKTKKFTLRDQAKQFSPWNKIIENPKFGKFM